jgi:hypothetical protein
MKAASREPPQQWDPAFPSDPIAEAAVGCVLLFAMHVAEAAPDNLQQQRFYFVHFRGTLDEQGDHARAHPIISGSEGQDSGLYTVSGAKD